MTGDGTGSRGQTRGLIREPDRPLPADPPVVTQAGAPTAPVVGRTPRMPRTRRAGHSTYMRDVTTETPQGPATGDMSPGTLRPARTGSRRLSLAVGCRFVWVKLVRTGLGVRVEGLKLIRKAPRRQRTDSPTTKRIAPAGGMLVVCRHRWLKQAANP